MRIHTNLSYSDVLNCAKGMPGVYFEILEEHGSRKRDRAFEVQLRGNSSRRPNNRGYDEGYAATWDEWGIFLNRLFQADPDASCPYYDHAGDFNFKTGHRFEDLTWEDQHKNHNWEYTGVPRQNSCKCGAVRRWG